MRVPQEGGGQVSNSPQCTCASDTVGQSTIHWPPCPLAVPAREPEGAPKCEHDIIEFCLRARVSQLELQIRRYATSWKLLCNVVGTTPEAQDSLQKAKDIVAERDGLRKQLDEEKKRGFAMSAEMEDLRAERDTLREALEPIDKIIAAAEDTWSRWDEDRSKLGVYLTAPQMRAIRAALAQGKESK